MAKKEAVTDIFLWDSSLLFINTDYYMLFLKKKEKQYLKEDNWVSLSMEKTKRREENGHHFTFFYYQSKEIRLRILKCDETRRNRSDIMHTVGKKTRKWKGNNSTIVMLSKYIKRLIDINQLTMRRTYLFPIRMYLYA